MSDLNEYLQPKESDNNAPITKVSDFVTAEHIDRNYDYPAGKINYTHITPSSRIYSAIVSLSGEVGTFKDIQLALNYVGKLGGGAVFIKNGTYILEKDLLIPSGVNIQGESASEVVLDFNGTAHQLNAIGEFIYDEGTISVNNNSTSVTGTGTVWESSLEGSFIQIRGTYYTILTVLSGTSLTIDIGFSGDNISQETYLIANPITGITISDITVQNSTHSDGSIYLNYSSGITIKNFTLITSTLGLKCINSDFPVFDSWNAFFCDEGVYIQNGANVSLSAWSIYNSLVGNGLSVHDINTLSLFNFSIFNSVGIGIDMSNTYNYAILNFSIISNMDVGLKMVRTYDGQTLSGNFMNNSTDAINLSSGNNRNIFSNLLIRNNTGYGIHITSIGNINNLITSCVFQTNSSGDILDSGTTTKIRSCIGPADN